MLEQLLHELRNWFVVEIYEGDFTIENGTLTPDVIADGQYFRICKSLFNDGVYRYPVPSGIGYGLFDEAFHGTVWALAIPNEIIDLAEQIEAWKAKYEPEKPFESESFGGYSYTKARNASGAPLTWQDAFRSQLNRWRKL